MSFKKALAARVAKAEALIIRDAEEKPWPFFYGVIDGSLGRDEDGVIYRDSNIIGVHEFGRAGSSAVDVSRHPGEDLEVFNSRCKHEYPDVRVFMYRYGGVESRH